MKFLKPALIFIFWTVAIFSASAQAKGGYALVRVFDCNKSVGIGVGYVDARIVITYEDGKQEEVELLPYNEKNEKENLISIVATLNSMHQKGYSLVSSNTTGEQGNIISDFTFAKN